jgi:hypothetical protein
LIVERRGKILLPSRKYEEQIIWSISQYLQAMQKIGVQTPIAIMLSLVNAEGTYMGTDSPTDAEVPIDSEFVDCPVILIEEFNTDIPSVLKPMFDCIWNACGFPHSQNYKDGNWNPR